MSRKECSIYTATRSLQARLLTLFSSAATWGAGGGGQGTCRNTGQAGVSGHLSENRNYSKKKKKFYTSHRNIKVEQVLVRLRDLVVQNFHIEWLVLTFKDTHTHDLH